MPRDEDDPLAELSKREEACREAISAAHFTMIENTSGGTDESEAAYQELVLTVYEMAFNGAPSLREKPIHSAQLAAEEIRRVIDNAYPEPGSKDLKTLALADVAHGLTESALLEVRGRVSTARILKKIGKEVGNE